MKLEHSNVVDNKDSVPFVDNNNLPESFVKRHLFLLLN